MAVTEIAVAAVAALVVLMAALVLVLSIPGRESRHAAAPRRAGQVPDHRAGQVPDHRAEHPGPFGPGNRTYQGAPGYGRPAGYGPPPLWGDANHRDPR